MAEQEQARLLLSKEAYEEAKKKGIDIDKDIRGGKVTIKK